MEGMILFESLTGTECH